MRPQRAVLAYVAVMVALLLLAGLAGSADYADEVNEQRAYCGHVSAGDWPDYKNLGTACGPGKGR